MRGEHRHAGALLGAADALRARIEAPVEPSFRPIYDHFERVARGDTPPADFAAARASGRALPVERATALAQELVA
jgi:hypothetical protein